MATSAPNRCKHAKTARKTRHNQEMTALAVRLVACGPCFARPRRLAGSHLSCGLLFADAANSIGFQTTGSCGLVSVAACVFTRHGLVAVSSDQV